MVRCLLSILEKANLGCEPPVPLQPLEAGAAASTPTPAKQRKGCGGKGEKEKVSGAGVSPSQNSWLNISMDAALGFRANVFQVKYLVIQLNCELLKLNLM